MAEEITRELAKSLLPQRPENSHKGTFGKVLNIAGSLNYQGAAYLSSIAALKAGAGYITLASIQSVLNNIAAKTPDITFLPLRDSYNQCIASDGFRKSKIHQRITLLYQSARVSLTDRQQQHLLMKHSKNFPKPICPL